MEKNPTPVEWLIAELRDHLTIAKRQKLENIFNQAKKLEDEYQNKIKKNFKNEINS